MFRSEHRYSSLSESEINRRVLKNLEDCCFELRNPSELKRINPNYKYDSRDKLVLPLLNLCARQLLFRQEMIDVPPSVTNAKLEGIIESNINSAYYNAIKDVFEKSIGDPTYEFKTDDLRPYQSRYSPLATSFDNWEGDDIWKNLIQSGKHQGNPEKDRQDKISLPRM